jgi:hypothetical protein
MADMDYSDDSPSRIDLPDISTTGRASRRDMTLRAVG